MATAALYLRSSKDRNDVSLAAQRRELEKLAASRSLTVVRSYEDAVESGATEDRPAFIELVRALKESNRGWSYLLVYDTSRIARRRYIAQAIKHEAKKRGVTIFYARLPADLDPVAELVLESVFEAMDEAHSLMSREKGLAGMAENVRRGWRAGGRAPLGYRLESHSTGAVREGRPVTKSKLVPSDAARNVGRYLKARAAGTPRCIALKEARLDRADSTMICVEWNALTYAGHTIWNRHAVQGTGQKRRPRAEWHIKRDTHAALITDAEAESILAQLETSEIGAAVSRAKAAQSSFLLTGMLYAGDGQMWVGHGDRYRLRAHNGRAGKTVPAETVDKAVLEQFDVDIGSDEFLARLLAAAKEIRRANPAADVEGRIRKAEREKARAAELALTSDESGTFLALVKQRSVQIEALKREADAVRADDALSRELASLTVPKLRAILADRTPAKAIQSLVERVVLDPQLTCRIEYKAVLGARGGYVPHPLGDAIDSHLLLKSLVALKGAA
jgi:DNA invertase Pin-like site-specific DNA recombinase